MKRISKSEQKRQTKKKKLKKQQRIKSLTSSGGKKELLSKLKNPIINSLITGIIFSILFPFYSLISSPKPTYADVPSSEPYYLSQTFKNTSIFEQINSQKETSNFRKRIVKIVKSTPMERMVDDISKRNKTVAAFLVGIAMKESKFGIYSPKKNGKDCFNYWGYRGKENATDSGYSCFSSPSQAISIVGNRIEAIVKQGVKTPAGMVVWKCGSTCEGFEDEDVTGWINDVGINYYKLSK